MSRRAAVVLAAGKGTRMKSRLAKVLHPVAGRPMVHYPVRTALEMGCDPVVVIVGHQRAEVQASLAQAFPGKPVRTAFQADQRGTAHAVGCAAEALEGFEGDVFILSGDVPGLARETLDALDAATGDAAVGVLGMRLDDPRAYGRLVRDGAGRLARIVEFRDCLPAERGIRDVNAGIYRVDARFLFKALGAIKTDNAQGEFYLTDIVEAAATSGRGAVALVLDGDAAHEANGINDRIDLAEAEARMQGRLRAHWMREGVTLRDPATTFFEDGVVLGPDTTLEPGVSLHGDTRIGAGCTIGMGSRITDSRIGDDVWIRACSHLEGAEVGQGCVIGPFARLRPATVLHPGVKIGNFVETKKTTMGAGAKASHLTYLGDASVGPRANVGAGTITCNYDGKNKHPTVIGEGAFIGSNTALVAPVTVADGAYVGGGSTITDDVPAGALAIGRARQKNIEGWVERRARAKE